MKNQYYTLIILVLLLSSCAQISSLQTAKTLPEDTTILGAAIAAYGVGNTEFIGNDLGVTVVPHFEIFGRQGFANNIDFGLKLSSSANIAIDGKYQFYGDQTSKFAMAVGAAFEYQYSNFENFVCRQTLPLYFSFHPNYNFALYASPKFIHQLVSDDDNTVFLGGNIGLQKRIATRLSILVEASSFVVFDGRFKNTDDLLYQGGIGFMFDLK